MATHSSVLDWRIPGTGEPGGLVSMGLHRVGHDWSDLAAAAAAVGSCCITQGTQSGALGWPRGVRWGAGREAPEGGDICILISDYCCMQKPTQYCKAIILQLNIKIKKNRTTMSSSNPIFGYIYQWKQNQYFKAISVFQHSIAALFIIVKIWKPKGLLMDEWIKKMW